MYFFYDKRASKYRFYYDSKDLINKYVLIHSQYNIYMRIFLGIKKRSFNTPNFMNRIIVDKTIILHIIILFKIQLKL